MADSLEDKRALAKAAAQAADLAFQNLNRACVEVLRATPEESVANVANLAEMARDAAGGGVQSW